MSAIISSELLFKYSVAASAGNTTAGAPETSLGDQISITEWDGGVANDLFPDITGADNAAEVVDYRCIFVHNSNTANALENAVVYISAEVDDGAKIAIGADPTAASTIGSVSAQAVAVANETTAPAGVTFSEPISAATGVDLGTIPASQCKAFWVRRTALNSDALSGDGVTLAVSGDTGSL